MKTCFKVDAPAPMIGIHLDRYAIDSSGAVQNRLWRLDLPTSLLLSFWMDASMHLFWKEYYVAVVLHAGRDGPVLSFRGTLEDRYVLAGICNTTEPIWLPWYDVCLGAILDREAFMRMSALFVASMGLRSSPN